MPLFMRRPTSPDIVEAEQVGAGANVSPSQGQRPPRPGDWVVTNYATAQTQTMTDEEFNAQYEPMALPSHLIQPVPGTGPEFEPTPSPFAGMTDANEAISAAPPVTPPAPTPAGVGSTEAFSPSGPTTPMNEGLVGRPAPTPEVRPRLTDPAPIETPTGLVSQPDDADKAFHAAEASPDQADIDAENPPNAPAAGESPE